MASLQTGDAPPRAPWHLWLVGTASLLWNGFGCYDYTMTQLDAAAYFHRLGLSAEALTYIEGLPAWLVGFWALGVWGSLLGSLLLLARSRHAPAAFTLSLVGLVVSQVYEYAGPMPAEMRTGAVMAMSGLIWGVLLLLVWYARRMRRAGVLG